MTSNRLLGMGLSFTAFSLIADQLLKSWAHALVETHGIIQPFAGLNIIATSNTGVAFSIAQGAAAWILISIGLALSSLLLVWLGRTRRAVHAVGLGLAIGGALSNVLDRLRLGAVRDFIDVYWRDWHWPAFNLADAAIVTGLAMVILFNEEPGRREKRSRHGDVKQEKRSR